MSSQNVSTARTKVETTRKPNGQFKAGYVGTMIRNTEATQARRRAVDANQANRDWLAAHGLGDLDPSEIFAA